MDDLATMGISGAAGFGTRQTAKLIGFGLQEYAKATAAAFKQDMEMHEAHEKSMDEAKGRGGGWLRLGLFILIAIGLLAGVLAGFMDKDLMVEKETSRNFLLWAWKSTKWVAVEGVPVFIEFKKGMLALIGFALGASVN